MTREERIEKLQHLITCMKCEVSGKSCDDNCPTQYDAGNMGEIIENLEEIVKAIEQEPCEDAISRDKAIVQLSHLQSDWDDDWNVAIRKCIEAVKIVPPVTPQPKTGHWIKTKEQDNAEPLILWKCSECLTVQRLKTNYCPNCGAKMIEPHESEKCMTKEDEYEELDFVQSHKKIPVNLVPCKEENKWIPVSEKLPEKYSYTLWCASSGCVRSDYFNGEFWEDAKKYCYEVIAWMPLPEPYRAESEEV